MTTQRKKPMMLPALAVPCDDTGDGYLRLFAGPFASKKEAKERLESIAKQTPAFKKRLISLEGIKGNLTLSIVLWPSWSPKNPAVMIHTPADGSIETLNLSFIPWTDL